MRSPTPAAVIIACPHCRTRYRVAPVIFGPGGRRLQCAQCGGTWQAEGGSAMPMPVPSKAGRMGPDEVIDADAERRLDQAFSDAEAAAVLLRPAKLPPETAFGPAAGARRPNGTPMQQPTERRSLLRRIGLTALWPALLLLLGAGIGFRGEIVRAVPDLAGAYAAIGLGSTVVALRIAELSAVTDNSADAAAMVLTARLEAQPAPAAEPPLVVVTLLNDSGEALNEWTMAAGAAAPAAGQSLDFTTSISPLPSGATRVRLSLAGAASTSEIRIAPAIEAQGLLD